MAYQSVLEGAITAPQTQFTAMASIQQTTSASILPCAEDVYMFYQLTGEMQLTTLAELSHEPTYYTLLDLRIMR